MSGRLRRMRRRPALLWGLAAIVQIALVLLPLGERMRVHAIGTEITLALRPVDPRDLLRGDYVILNPEIGRLSGSLAADAGNLEPGDEVWTVVEADGEGVARPVGLLAAAPADGRAALRGRVTARRDDSLSVDYGLTAFYVPEGQGLAIERLPRESLRIVVAVTGDGRSAPLRLIANGKVLLSESAF